MFFHAYNRNPTNEGHKVLNHLAPVAGHLNRHRKAYAAAAVTTGAATVVTRRVKQWKLFFNDPQAFDAQYPAK